MTWSARTWTAPTDDTLTDGIGRVSGNREVDRGPGPATNRRKVRPLPSHLSTQIDDHLQHLDRHHRRRRLLERWAVEPALRGHTPATILGICGRSSTEQNPVVAALLRLHQSGDPDAGVVLLTALRPMIKAVVRCRNGHLTDEVIDNYWSAASHLIGSTDPNREPLGRDGFPTPFIRHLGNRLHQHARDLAPSERRWRSLRRRGELPGSLDVPHGSGELVDYVVPRTAGSVEDRVLARLELDDVAAAVDSGAIPAERWQRLVAHRLGARVTYAPVAERVAIHRTATRLAGIVGHAA